MNRLHIIELLRHITLFEQNQEKIRPYEMLSDLLTHPAFENSPYIILQDLQKTLTENYPESMDDLLKALRQHLPLNSNSSKILFFEKENDPYKKLISAFKKMDSNPDFPPYLNLFTKAVKHYVAVYGMDFEQDQNKIIYSFDRSF